MYSGLRFTKPYQLLPKAGWVSTVRSDLAGQLCCWAFMLCRRAACGVVSAPPAMQSFWVQSSGLWVCQPLPSEAVIKTPTLLDPRGC